MSAAPGATTPIPARRVTSPRISTRSRSSPSPIGRAFSPQQEIHDYLRQCVEKYDLGRHIRLDTEVTGAEFDAAAGVWTVRIRDGLPLAARALVLGNGALSIPSYPDLPGLEAFAWPRGSAALQNHISGHGQNRVSRLLVRFASSTNN